MSRFEFYWERTREGGVRLLRVYGANPVVELPEEIAGLPLTEIGAYCFAQSSHLPEEYERCVFCDEEIALESNVFMDAYRREDLRELCGRYLEEVILPDAVQRLGNLAFYNCTSLRYLELGGAMEETGSDAFMNCLSLHRICLRCGIRERSGIRQILSQISSDMEVSFEGKEGTEAVLLFPEYYESIDEIAPAHLFGRNIEGEGFRARQCFKEGIADLVQYDAIFPKASSEEPVGKLCRLALNRLRYPAGLSVSSAVCYEAYIREHAGEIIEESVRKRDTCQILFLCEQRLVSRPGLEAGICAAAEADWAEGAACLLHLKEKFFVRESGSRYSFDDF